MATTTEEPTITMETCGDDVSDPTMETIGVLSDVSMASRSLPVGVVSTNFKVTRGFGGIAENVKVNVDRLYLRQVMTGWDANQSDVIQPNAVTGLGKTAVNNWGVYDGAGSKAELVAKTHGMHTLAGKWSNWFTLAFVVGRFEASTLQVMGANDEDEADNDWAIVGGTGEFAMARGIIRRRVYSITNNTLTHALTIEFFCHMTEVVPSPTKRGTVGGNRGTLPREMEGKSQRLENVTIYHVGAVEGFQFSYVDEDGKIRTTDTWGRVHPDPLRKTEIKFGPSEFVKKVNGAQRGGEGWLSRFEIVTTHKTYGPFGVDNGTPNFSYTVPEDETVVGFFGNTDNIFVTSIGVYTI
ncbi:hypothetical protein CFC21_055112 [Triticum aestivum]|uniref:Dirigent protein n=2 Tax=Triticum aestivum TaxID=4565 RepID=A0A9R1GEI7_WHEAT|nr:uncharacterized protein LOC123083263 [Triticum aestivum]KAF7046062.1 hypothetical protein CFC21_055112 [Triticum aestivum]